MEIIPIVDRGLGNSAYLVNLGDGQALMIDAERDPTPYLAEAERRRLRIRWVVETHLHADFVSGGRELASEGARLLAPAESHLQFDHVGLRDGDAVDLGGLTLEVVATPGHTPEHLAYLLYDGTAPQALFSGGTLIAGGVARTDLVSPDLTEQLARAAYRSIRDRLLVLPDELHVYPTHGAGSFCSVAPTGERTTTIFRERTTNPLLQAADEDEFVAMLTGGLGTYPSYFQRLRDVNRAGPRVLGRAAAPPPLSPGHVARLMEDGAEVIDIRLVDRFAAGHVPGSLSIELRDQFTTWLGWLVDLDRTVVLVADSDEEVGEAARRFRQIGYERLEGHLEGGTEAWMAEGRAVARIPLVAPAAIPPDATLVDVRQESEWVAGHVPGAVHLELGTIADHAGDLAGDLVLHCGHGARAMSAASLLRRAGVATAAVTKAGADDLIRLRAAATA